MTATTPITRLGSSYFLLLGGQSLATLGAATNAIGLVLLMLESDSPVKGIGLVQLMLMVPWVVLGPLSGVVADRWPKRRSIVLCDLARGMIALALIWGQGWQWALLLMVVASTCIDVLFAPTLRSFIPEIVPTKSLPRAVSGYEFCTNAARIIGAVLGGAISSQFGFTGVCLVNAGAFTLSALLMTAIRTRACIDLQTSEQSKESVMRSMRAGLQYINCNINIRFVVLFFAVATFFFATLPIVLPVAITTRLDLDATAYSALVSANAAGALVGAALTAYIGKARSKLRWMTLGVCGFGVSMFLIVSVVPSWGAALALYAIAGCISSIVDVVYEIFLQTNADPDYLGRVFSLDLALSNATALTGIAFITFVVPSGASQLSAEALSGCLAVVSLAGFYITLKKTKEV